MSSKNIVILCLITIISALFYKVAGNNVDIVESFWPTSGNTLTAVVQTNTPDGFGAYKNNQNQLCHDPNPLINTNLLSSNDAQFVKDSLSAPGSVQYNQYMQELGEPPKELSEQINLQEAYCNSCNYKNEGNVPVSYTVPGNYQAPIPPRMNSNGLESYIRYELPSEGHLANEAQNPLMIANQVEKPNLRENFTPDDKAFHGDTPKQYDNMYHEMKKEGNDAFNQLPIAGMGNGVSASEENNEFYVNTNRLTFALNKNRLTGLGDFIRGDLPVVPCNPDSNPYSNTWFRPSARPHNLLSGAVNVIAGVGNVTSQQTSELQMRDVGSTNNTFGAVPLVAQQNTPVGQAIDYQQVKLNQINPGNSINLQSQSATGSIANSTVTTTAFP